MDRDARGAQEPPLIPQFDPDSRVVYVPVRHHSPACAWHVDRLVRAIRPDAVLIEGPRDATHLIPLLTHEETRLPVAIYTTYVQRRTDEAGAEGPESTAIHCGMRRTILFATTRPSWPRSGPRRRSAPGPGSST